ncbi:MAG: hypothetical protein M0O94_02905, partial [Bacteroidales bacterium]|nr:hypothetical protein [Bacteroidales bacterium]
MANKTKILHLYSDEKFYNFIKLTFNIDELSNTYLNLSENNSNINIDDYSAIIVHYLDTLSINFIKQHEIVQPIVWFFWGGDGFSLGKFTYLFLENKTKKARIKLAFQKSFVFGIKQIIKLIYPELLDYQKYTKHKINIIEKFRLIVPIMPGDYDILKNKYQITPPKLHLNYANPLFSYKIFPKTNGTNILLGNSAS